MKIKSVEMITLDEPVDVYDIGVQDNHNYFVTDDSSNTPVLVHNCHRGSAKEYAKVVSAFNNRWQIGLSATPRRKDGLHFLIDFLTGPLIKETSVESISPTMKIIETGFSPKHVPSNWTNIIRMLERDEKRNLLIVKHAVHDIKQGRHIVIPVDFQTHNDWLVDEINSHFDRQVAYPFHGKLNKKVRSETLELARKGKAKCIVARRSMLTGVNIPVWDAIYQSLPSANQYNYEQEVMRVCTPMQNKPPPIVKYFIDDMSICYSCFLVVQKAFKNVGMKFTEKSKAILPKIYEGARKKYSQKDSDELGIEHKEAPSTKLFGTQKFPNKVKYESRGSKNGNGTKK